MTKSSILIVDDNPANLKVSRFALESEGYRVSTASDAEEALLSLQKIRPELILMDIQLPGMDGLQLTRLLKSDSNTEGIVIVAVTAYAMLGDREKAMKAGCDGYLSKPVDPILLPSQVQDYLDAARTPSEIAANPIALETSSHNSTGDSLADYSSRLRPSAVSKQILLVIDENLSTCKMYRLALETERYEVVEVHSGAAALDALVQLKPDLLIFHLHLPDMSLAEMCSRIRFELGDRRCPIVGVSGHQPEGEEAELTRTFFDRFLLTPIDPFTLAETAKDLLDSVAPSNESVGKKELLVIVDDDPQQRRLAEAWFVGLGFDVIVAKNAGEAIELARKNQPRAIISDVLMPNMDGFSLCLAVRSDPKISETPVILTSAAYAERADQALAKRVGASALVLKEGGFEAVAAALGKSIHLSPPSPLKEPIPLLEAEHSRRQSAQLDRQVLENASLLRRTVLDQAQLAVFAGVANSLANDTMIDAVIGDVLAACLEMAGVSKGALFVGRTGTTLKLRHRIGFNESEELRLRARFNHPELFTAAVERGDVIVVPSDGIAWQTVENILADASVASLLIAPVTSSAITQGVLLLAARANDTPDWTNNALIRALGAQMGQALSLAQAFEKLTASELRYRTLTENANDTICILSADGTVRESNRRLAQITGYSTEHFVGRRLQDFAAQADKTRTTHSHQFPMQNGQLAFLDFSHAQVEVNGEKLTFSIGRDVTAQVQANREREDLIAELKKGLDERTTLIQEMQHRVKNNMAVISGLLAAQAHELEDGPTRTALEDSRLRVESMGMIHDHMYASDHLDRVDFSQYVKDLSSYVALAYSGQSVQVPIRFEVEEIQLPLDRAIPCALILNELLANAVRSASAGGRKGEIAISFSRIKSDEYSLSCSDDGPPRAETLGSANPHSLGLEIATILAEQIDGHLNLNRSNGVTRFEVRFPDNKESPERAAKRASV